MISWQLRCEVEAEAAELQARAFSVRATMYGGLQQPSNEAIYLGLAADYRNQAADWRRSAGIYETAKAAQRVAE